MYPDSVNPYLKIFKTKLIICILLRIKTKSGSGMVHFVAMTKTELFLLLLFCISFMRKHRLSMEFSLKWQLGLRQGNI